MSSDRPADGIDVGVPPTGTGCQDCDAASPPGWWVHLRRCAQCGHVGCCDSSPSGHATVHALATGHRYIQSFEPGEDWFFDYATGQAFDGPVLTAPESRPEHETAPGPRDRVPDDWMMYIHQ